MAEDFTKKQEADKALDRLYLLMAGVVIVLFVGFAGMFVAVGQMMIDSLGSKQESYNDLQEKVNKQNGKIDNLTREVQRLNEQETIQAPN